MLVLGALAFCFVVALTIRCYMPCPFSDQWDEMPPLAGGHAPSWAWLWSQHNEHRIFFPRLLILLDIRAFHSKNVSLFFALYAIQILHCAAICGALEWLTGFPNGLKRTLQGLFAFCLFNPNQAENFTWAFQIGFLGPFAVASIMLLLLAFIDRFRRPLWVVIGAGFGPLLASLAGLGGGLLVALPGILLAYWKRLTRRELVLIASLSLACIMVYLWGYQTPSVHHDPRNALTSPWQILLYVLTYFDASWLPFQHRYRLFAPLSFLALAVLGWRAWKNRDRTTDFELFCLAECLFILLVATATALGRAQFGNIQATTSRYQTPAMLYWSSLGSLCLIAVWQSRPQWRKSAQQLISILAIYSLIFWPVEWWAYANRFDSHRRSCAAVIDGHYSRAAARDIYGERPNGVLDRVGAALRESWKRPEAGRSDSDASSLPTRTRTAAVP